MKNRLFAYFDNNPNIAYPLVIGNTYRDNFNEEIDSMSVVLDNVGTTQYPRLDFEEPYHFVKIENRFELNLNDLKEQDKLYLNSIDEIDALPIFGKEVTQLYITNITNFSSTPNTGDIFYYIVIYNDDHYLMTGKVVSIHTVLNATLVNYSCLSYKKLDYEGITFNDSNTKIMVIDTCVETETNMQEHIYRYEIQLMNCIKLFEKIQCSNRMITHSLVDGSKTIYEYIDEYMRFYSPKIKMSTDGINWSYEYLFKWQHLSSDSKFKQICADMQLNEPTLRDLLTQLMLQVDRIPTCEYRTLGFIDFKQKSTEFIPSSRTSKTESLASDSYNTSLTVSPTQILDSDNNVVTEQIGFRDRTNAILSQLSNLQLETRFPIYNIKKCYLSYADTSLLPTPLNQFNYNSTTDYPDGNYPIYGADIPTSTKNFHPHFINNNTQIRVFFSYYGGNVRKGKLKNIKVHFCKWNEDTLSFDNDITLDTGNTEWEILWDNQFVGNVGQIPYGYNGQAELLSNGTIGTVEPSTIGYQGYGFCYYIDLDLPLDFNINTYKYAWFENDFIDYSQDDAVVHQYLPIREWSLGGGFNTFLTGLKYHSTNTFSSITLNNVLYDGLIKTQFFTIDGSTPMTHSPASSISGIAYAADITNLMVESRKRQLLSTNFVDMEYVRDHPLEFDPDEFEKYIYGTMGYTIGQKTITGFSSSYSKVHLWWDKTTSYFDNILTYLNNYNTYYPIITLQPINYDASYIQELSNKLGGIPLNAQTLTPQGTQGFPITNDKGRFFFNITYQPLNNLKLVLPKEDKNIPLDLTTLNNSENGLADFDRFTKYSQSMADRIGNKIIQISQVTDNINELMPLNSIYDNKYVVFKREIAIYEDYLTILYTMSEKYVLQNYFTSIVTKYRAYENTDYEAAITRKENLTIYCLISADTYYDGDDHVLWSDNKFEGLLLSGLSDSYIDENNQTINFPIDLNITYVVRKSKNIDNQNESTKEEISLPTYKNGFAIVFEEFDNVSAGLYLSQADIPGVATRPLSGIEQIWQRWNMDVYKEKQELTFVYRIMTFGLADDTVSSMIKYPILDNNKVNYESFSLFKIVDDKETTEYTYNKDISEILNQTVQFYFYNNNDEIEFTQVMFRNCVLVNQSQIKPDRLFLTFASETISEDKTIAVSGLYRYRLEMPDFEDYFRIGYDANINKWYIDIDWEDFIVYYDEYDGREKPASFDKIILSKYIGQTTSTPRRYNFTDYISFKRREVNTRYYLTLNNTKTNDVWYFSDEDDLFETRECDNTIERKIKSI